VHIGATSLPDGLTKGDVDVNVRVPADRFDEAVRELSSRYERAQIQNWTPTYASFADGAEELLLGIQVTVVGAADDFSSSCTVDLSAIPHCVRPTTS
jgi:hypothetical protein